MNNNNDSEKSSGGVGSLVSGGMMPAWARIPLVLKLKIIGVVALVVLFIVVIAAIIGSFSFNFLDYSGDAETSDDLKSEYEEYWSELCEEEGENCTSDQVAAASELKASQEKFYDKFEKLSNKYMSSDSKTKKEQKYLVLSTIFYDYDIEEFSEGNNAYTIDGSDEIDFTTATYDATTEEYQKETDSLKELIKQFSVYTAVCNYKDETGNDASTPLQSNGETIILNFFEYVTYRFTGGDDEYKAAKEDCEKSKSGSVELIKDDSGTASFDNYYKYLRTTDYFDQKERLKSYFSDYADAHKDKNLDANDLSSWSEEDLEEVRSTIIDNIKDIVEEYMEEQNDDSGYISVSSGTSYWWPIGSLETTESDGVTFASGDPESTTINSNYGMRLHPKDRVWKLHNGVDLHGNMGTTNIIASMGGTVQKVRTYCDSYNSAETCGGYGNYVEILDTKGNINIYAHMFQNSATVQVGDTVKQGQVLGKVGSSGNSTGPHLHFTIMINGTAVDPLNYISADDPRPAGGSGSAMAFYGSPNTREEFISKLQAFYQANDCGSNYGCNSFKNNVLGDGAGIIYDVAAEYGLNPQLVVARSRLEGYSPGTGYNYFGYAVYNGSSRGTSFSSFKAAIEEYYKNISAYKEDTNNDYTAQYNMFHKYAWLGDYWYNPGSPGLGGCYYASYIYPDGVPERVQSACASGKSCSKGGGSNCVATVQEDWDAYASWQISKMATAAADVFN